LIDADGYVIGRVRVENRRPDTAAPGLVWVKEIQARGGALCVQGCWGPGSGLAMLVTDDVGKGLPFTPRKRDRNQPEQAGHFSAQVYISCAGPQRQVSWLPSEQDITAVALMFRWRQVLEGGAWRVHMDLERVQVKQMREQEFGCAELQAVMYHLIDHWPAIPMNVLCGVIQRLKRVAGASIERPLPAFPC